MTRISRLLRVVITFPALSPLDRDAAAPGIAQKEASCLGKLRRIGGAATPLPKSSSKGVVTAKVERMGAPNRYAANSQQSIGTVRAGQRQCNLQI
jgi:hypothetical protein